MTKKRNIAARAGSWSARHKKTAILGWLAFVAVALVLGGAVGTKQLADQNSGAGEARTGARIVHDAFPQHADESVLVQARAKSDPALERGVHDVREAVGRFDYVRLKHVDRSGDGRSALVHFEIPGDDETKLSDEVTPVMAAVAKVQRQHRSLTIGEFGDASANKALGDSFAKDFRRAESLSVPITLVILFFAFGALVAAGLPVLLALSAVGASLGLVALPSQLLPVDQSISSVVLLIGMAVGVDYSLFYLRREREERRKGRDALSAIDVAAATSGRAVLVSGLTVMIAMSGMFLTGHGTFMSFAVGTMIVVAVAMLGSITVLPATLSALGSKVERGRLPLVSRLRRGRRDGDESRIWNAVLDRVLARPAIALVAATALLVALAIPALGMKTADTGIDDLPRAIPIMKTYDQMQAAFPGGQIPAVVAIKAGDVTEPAVARAIRTLGTKAVATGDMSGPTTLTVSPDKTVATLAIPVAGNGTDARSAAAVKTLRDTLIPETVGRVGGTRAVVTGMTAGSMDFNSLMKSKAPLVFAFVLSLAFLLLLVTFRSVVVPLKAIVLNLLSVGAAYGVLVLVFQHGWGAGLLGVDASSQGFITSWLPMFLFVILFGLSMDYHVFILSRIREAVDRGMRTEDAVAHGIKSTAGVVTSAAVVMVAVFAIFATLSFIDMKQMGVGLAAAVLIDATIVRGVLLPAAMKLLGERNWWLPTGVARRLPRQPVLEGAH